jgi:hypothetical protein
VRLEGADHAYDVAVGGTEDVVPDGDEGERILAVEQLAAACGGARDLTPPQVFSKEMLKGCPRVDGPKIRDEPGDAIREDTPGYIVCAFPKLFPFGSGDFHSARGNLRSRFEFSELQDSEAEKSDRYCRVGFCGLDQGHHVCSDGISESSGVC